jgi:hypothetical protein
MLNVLGQINLQYNTIQLSKKELSNVTPASTQTDFEKIKRITKNKNSFILSLKSRFTTTYCTIQNNLTI